MLLYDYHHALKQSFRCTAQRFLRVSLHGRFPPSCVCIHEFLRCERNMNSAPWTSKAGFLADEQFAADVQSGLAYRGQKSLPPKYLYDTLGMVLFEAITQLPEYGLWRAEHALFQEHAGEIARRTSASNVIELGSGSATKTAVLLKALLRHQSISYWAVDVSSTALELTHRTLSGMDGLRLHSVQGEYVFGLDIARRSATRGTSLVLLLGSSLGNLDFAASMRFLRHVRAGLKPGDGLLLGADLLKDEARLLAAYDDAIGLTAAFNLNLLVRMNRELGADFAVRRFKHRARFNTETHDVEMHLESLGEQRVHFVNGFSLALQDKETILTETSHKYSLAELDCLAANCGFNVAGHWTSPEWQFASRLLVAV